MHLQKEMKKAFLALFLLLHIVGVSHFIDITQITNDTPILIADYGVHAYNTLTLAETFREGHTWFYDVSYMAGYPNGAFFDISIKSAELFTFLFGGIVGDAVALKILILLTYLFAPLLVYPATRLLEFSKDQALLATIIALILWDLDPFMKIVVDFGGFGFITASYFALLTVGCFYQWIQQPTKKKYLATLAASWAAILFHPVIVFAFSIPCAIFLYQQRKEVTKKTLVHLAALPVLLFILHSFWILPFLTLSHYKTTSAQYMQSVGFVRIFLDLVNPFNIFRTLAYILAGVGVYMHAKKKTITTLTLTSLLFFLICYIHLAFIEQIQPFRFYTPLLIFLIPAITLGYIHIQKKWPKANKIALAVLCIILIAYPFRVAPLVQEMPQQEQELIGYLQANTDNSARILVETAGNARDDSLTNVFPDHFLPLYIDRQIIGGPYQYYYTQQGYANFVDGELFNKQLSTLTSEKIEKYMQDFNIGWVVARKDSSQSVFATEKLFTLQKEIGEYRIYKVNKKFFFTDDVSAQVEAQKNMIQVTNAKEQQTILKYHYLETLTTKEGFKIEPFDNGYPTPFIKVINNGEDFTIVNTY